MAVIEIAKIQVRTGQELQTGIPQLDPGEFGWAQDTQKLYIGKRVEGGANSDDNTRVLTEPDLENIFALINSTSSNVLKYQYRDQIPYFAGKTAVRTVSDKLDELSVSIFDFGAVQGVTGTNIGQVLETAVEALYGEDRANWFDPETADSRRVLKIPAGSYIVDRNIQLPPFASIEGDGPGLTRLTFINSTTNLFSTVDADNTNWNGGMDNGVKRSKEVAIKGMTLEYAVTATSNNPLVSLDNVLNATVENVEFKTQVNSTTTTTYGLVTQGVGVRFRGEGSGLGSGDSNLCQNIQIVDCKFDSLLTGIEGTGSVIRSFISNNVFSNLDRGVKLHTVDTTPAPSNSYILDNRFQNIVKEAIFVGTQTSATNHISENNFFIQVGNGTTLDDTTSSTASAVISFFAPGNKSINDHFQRKALADDTTSASFYYNPLVAGIAVVVDNTVYSQSLTPGVHSVTKFALTGSDQSIDVNYKLYKSDHSYTRTGKLLVNISEKTATDEETGAISDYYNFSYGAGWLSGDPDYAVFSLTTSTKNYLELKMDNWSVQNLILEYQVAKAS